MAQPYQHSDVVNTTPSMGFGRRWKTKAGLALEQKYCCYVNHGRHATFHFYCMVLIFDLKHKLNISQPLA